MLLFIYEFMQIKIWLLQIYFYRQIYLNMLQSNCHMIVGIFELIKK